MVSLLSVLSLGITAYISERDALKAQVLAELDTIVQLKETQLNAWFHERRADLHLISLSDVNREYLGELLDSDTSAADREHYTSILLTNLNSMKINRPYYRRIELLDVEGRVILSTDPQRIQQMTTDGTLFHNVLTSAPHEYIEDLHVNPETNEIEMIFGQVIYPKAPESFTVRRAQGQNPIGLVVLNIAVEDSLFPLFNHWPGDVETGEMMLGRDNGSDILILNPLLRAPYKALALRIPKMSGSAAPMDTALRGVGGTMLTTDYRGIPVVAAFRPTRNMDWGILVKMDQKEAFDPIASLARRISVIGVLSFMVAWTLAFIVWRRIALPLGQLVQATQTVIEGDYTVDLRVKHNDEIGLLARSFKKMLKTLERRQHELQMAHKVVADTALTNTRLVEELKMLNADLESKVQDRTKELSEANQKLTQLDQLKSKFISNVSHELRNPVASLKLYLRLLEKSTNENRNRYIASIAGQVDWLGKLIENILDLTQLEQGSAPLELAYIDLKEIILQILEIYEPIAADASIRLLWKLHDSPLYIYGSENKIRQMITNLLANAVNYTSVGTITVHLHGNEHDAVLTIEDTGIGIEAEDLPHLFERFYRGKNTHELEIRGTGLGLGIVSEIIEMHAGHIEVESQIGVGSRFQVFLPLSHPVTSKHRHLDAHHQRDLSAQAAVLKIWSTNLEE